MKCVHQVRTALPAAILLAILPFAAMAQPAALVEDVSSRTAKVQPLDYVNAGQVIQLAAGDTLTLGYMASCVQEQIVGGKVTVGAERSEVEGGKVDRATTQCAGSQLSLAADQSVHSGAAAVRAIGDTSKAQMTVYHVSPVIAVAKPAATVIKRVDVAGERHRFEADPAAKAIDLAAKGVSLTPGGVYMASSGGRWVIFEVAKNAGSGKTPLVGRMVPL